MDKKEYKILEILKELYREDACELLECINKTLDKYKNLENKAKDAQCWISENDSMLITYADMIGEEECCGVKTLHNLLSEYVGDTISAVHLLPFFPYSSDDGFSVIDYRAVRDEAGCWQDIKDLSQDYDLMFDAVINHVSCKSEWFKGYLCSDKEYQNYFIESECDCDYSMVNRPRDLPLFTQVSTAKGKRNVWTTFSSDQIDLNFKEGRVLLEIIDILLMYMSRGARFIRLDAIGFLWKENGTSCMHLEQTHKVIKLLRLVLEQANESVVLITETNTPHEQNISYFGNGGDEAHMVYQFPLPPLTLHAFLRKDSTALLNWAAKMDELGDNATYFNFLASHDGIGLKPLKGILHDSEIDFVTKTAVKRGGLVSYFTTEDGKKEPYELNINYLDAICEPWLDDETKIDKFMASQAILLSVVGMPGIYIHSLLGSTNDIKGAVESGIKRRINRQKLDKETLTRELDNPKSFRSRVLSRYLELINIRKTTSAFSPCAHQRPINLDKRLFCIERHNRKTQEKIRVIINLTDERISLRGGGLNLITKSTLPLEYETKPYQIIWLSL